MKKIAIIISHPIQYYVPLFQALAKNDYFKIKVFYTWGEESINKFDPGFNRVVEWDLPLLEGYSYEFMKNVAVDPGTHHFNGIDNPDVLNKIKEFNPDKLIVFGWSFKSHLKSLRYFKGKIPIYFRGDSHLLNSSSRIKNIVRTIFLRWVYSHIDYAVSVGTNNRNYYLRMGLSENQILFAPHAIDNSRFYDLNQESIAFQRRLESELSIPDNYLKFIYIGKFEYRKDLETLIKAKILLKDKPIALIIVGNGPDEQKLKQLAQDDSNIHFMDFVNQSQVPAVYRCADVFVLPSISETWGLGINEAMCSGLAILASDKVGSAIDLVNGNGYIFRNRDVQDLCDKMILMLKEPKEIEKFKIRSKELIQDWSMDALIYSFEKILNNEF